MPGLQCSEGCVRKDVRKYHSRDLALEQGGLLTAAAFFITVHRETTGEPVSEKKATGHD
jgi:hypothetical protein